MTLGDGNHMDHGIGKDDGNHPHGVDSSTTDKPGEQVNLSEKDATGMNRPAGEDRNVSLTALGDGGNEATHVDVAASQGEPAGSAVAERDRLVAELVTTRQGRTHADAR
eukprot:4824142-Lingulodinium_polyedra.AAC.1